MDIMGDVYLYFCAFLFTLIIKKSRNIYNAKPNVIIKDKYKVYDNK